MAHRDVSAGLAVHGIRPYRVHQSGWSWRQLMEAINRENYYGFGADLDRTPGRTFVSATLASYAELLRRMSTSRDVSWRTLRNVAESGCATDGLTIAIRHDVDSDLIAALGLAEIEREAGISSTWFVLHTAPYYGYFDKQVFHRHEQSGWIFRRIQDLGHEIGLHTDPLMIYQRMQVDGAAAIIEELDWLRAEGLEIVGTAAHNFLPSYGAENFEIFQSYIRWDQLEQQTTLPQEVVHEGRWAPLRVLDERELGLCYEANELFLRGMRYYFISMLSANRWQWDGPDPDDPGGWIQRLVEDEDVFEEMASIPDGSLIILSVHPCYFGARMRPKASPIRRWSPAAGGVAGEEITCLGHPPGTTVAGVAGACRDIVAINVTNELGFIDRSVVDSEMAPAGRRILLVGGDNLEGVEVPVNEHVGQRLARQLDERLGGPIVVRTIAMKGQGLARLWPAVEAMLQRYRFDVVILGIGDQLVAWNDRRIWAAESGLSALHCPFAYVHAPADGAVIEVAPSEDWARYRREPRQVSHISGCGRDPRRIPYEFSGNGACDAGIDAAVALYAWAGSRLRSMGACPLLLVEGLGEAAGRYASGGASTVSEVECRTALRCLGHVAARAGIELLNPYPGIDCARQRGRRTHVPGTQVWGLEAHAIAAQTLLEPLAALLADPARRLQPGNDP